jgi:hypothetical protein
MSIHKVLLACLAVLSVAAGGLADDFRIETKTYNAKDKALVSQNLTLFQAGFVYDYLSQPERVAVFDRARGRFILLDPARKIKVQVRTDDVLVFAEKYHGWAAKSSNEFMRFAADPSFDVKLGTGGELTLDSPHVSYRLETVRVPTPEAVRQYREFSDWYVRFNGMMNVGSAPPFLRLAVNRELAERSLIPTEVVLNIPAQTASGLKPIAMRTEHKVSWKLLQPDLEKIAETGNHLAAFKTVDLGEFEPDLVGRK